jgi:hypothetical protein
MPPKEEILRLRLSEELKKEAVEFAKSEGESLAVITRLALKEYMESAKSRRLSSKKLEIDLYRDSKITPVKDVNVSDESEKTR